MKRLSHTHTRRGFGLLETMICLSLMSLLFLGAMDLIMSAARSTVRTQAQVYSTGDAANAIQQVIGQLHEASAFSLPTSTAAGQAENNWIPVGALTMDQFNTTLPDGSPDGETINTAIEIIAPPAMTPASDGYTGTPLPALSVVPIAGGFLPVQIYDARALGSLASGVLLIYRGNADGTPNAKSGTYLWQYKVPATGVFDLAGSPPTALCKSVSPAPNAVQFVRPSYGNVAEPHQMEIKIISSYYSPINGQQTNEEGGGASSSALTGKCVYMRDHFTGSGDAPTNTGARTGNNTFQYH